MTDDGSRIRLHLLDLAPKTSVAVNFGNTGLAGTAPARNYLNSLTDSKNALLSSLESVTAGSDNTTQDAAASYIQLLLGLINRYDHGTESPALNAETGLVSL